MIRNFILAFLILFNVGSAFGMVPKGDDDVVLYAQDIPASELVGILYREVFRKPFVTSPQVQANRSLVSVHIAGTQKHAISQAKDYLAALGFVIVDGKDVDRVELPSPPEPKAPEPPDSHPYFYSPKWRTSGDLANVLRSLFPESRFSGGSNTKGEGSAGQNDKLVVHASMRSLGEIKSLLPKLDTPVADVMIKAAIYEVGTDFSDGSAFQMAVSLLSGKLEFGIEPQAGAGLVGSFVSIRSSNFESVLSALSTDGRFKVQTAPAVRARSGSPTKLMVGESVPVLGSVSYPDGGGSTPIQSVNYRDAGVSFSVLPVVQEKVIAVDLEQEISDFVKTTTGVNNTPTLTRRALQTTLSLQDGDVILLGGLTKTKDANAKEGFSFLPDFLRSNNKTQSRTDLLLILQVERLKPADGVLNMVRSVTPIESKEARPVPSPQVLRAIQSGKGGLF